MSTGVEYVRELCKNKKVPISTLEKECGFANGYLNPKKASKIPYERALLITKFMNKNGVTADLNRILGVASGEKAVELNPRDERDIAKRLDNTLSDLENSQSTLMFYGEPLDDETRELLKASLENSIRIAKINAKQKFTPKKYRTSGE